MPSGDDIQTYLVGAWRLMTGKPDGIRMLDVSADGFWNSFFAILIAAPALIVGWVAIAGDMTGPAGDAGGRFGTVVRLALVDIGAWIVPLAILALMARPLGIGDRYVQYVVASNWASAVIVWIMLPAALLRLTVPAALEAASALSLALFILSLVLTWRLTNAVVDRGPIVATAVFLTMLVTSIAVLFALQSLLGVSDPAPAA